MLQCVAVCCKHDWLQWQFCSVLQCTEVCCSVLACVRVYVCVCVCVCVIRHMTVTNEFIEYVTRVTKARYNFRPLLQKIQYFIVLFSKRSKISEFCLAKEPTSHRYFFAQEEKNVQGPSDFHELACKRALKNQARLRTSDS